VSFKNILFFLPTYPDPPHEQTIHSVGFLAQATSANITGFITELNEDASTWPKIMGAFPLDFPLLMAEAVRSSQGNAKTLAAALAKMASDYGVAVNIRSTLANLYASPQPLIDLARLHDLTVLPIPETDSFDRKYLEAIMFKSGRPILLLPSGKGHKPLQAMANIVVAWDFSREAAQAISEALPILVLAKQVHIVTILGEKHIQTTSNRSDLEQYLRSHGLKYVIHEATLKDQNIGERLSSYVSDAGADMLVMGAYGHSRFQEFALGGATRTMISDARIPLFMSH
jgi:nucleotide-binding universal stress UspA family protein